MKRFILMFAILALASCKTPQVVPLVLRDSVSITYKQGSPLPLSVIEECEAKNTPGLAEQDHRVEPCRPGACAVKPGIKQSVGICHGANGCEIAKRAGDILIRVDTIVVERWHTQQVPAPDKPIPRFYKDCTKGFWILLILLLGSFGFRIMRAIYLRK